MELENYDLHFDCWYEELCVLARKFGLNVSDQGAWHEPFDDDFSPLEALAEEYPHVLIPTELDEALPSAEEVAKIINVPLDRWPGNCFGIAMAIVNAGIIKGTAVYGHYNGFVADDSLFAGKPLIHHGWIVKDTGHLIDPTRWVFESEKPYLCLVGPRQLVDYDEGGNIWRLRNARPAPAYDHTEKQYQLCSELRPVLSVMLGRKVSGLISTSEALWVANLSTHSLGILAKPIYEEFIRLGIGALIPIDNVRMVLGTFHPRKVTEDSGFEP